MIQGGCRLWAVLVKALTAATTAPPCPAYQVEAGALVVPHDAALAVLQSKPVHLHARAGGRNWFRARPGAARGPGAWLCTAARACRSRSALQSGTRPGLRSSMAFTLPFRSSILCFRRLSTSGSARLQARAGRGSRQSACVMVRRGLGACALQVRMVTLAHRAV